MSRSSLRFLAALQLFVLVFSSCRNSGAGDESQAGGDSLAGSGSAPLIVIHRAKFAVNDAESPAVKKAGKPKVFPANGNIIPVTELTTIEATKDLPKVTPGTDTFSLPSKVEISIRKRLCIQPAPVAAAEPRFKDAAISDIRYLDVDQGMSSSFIRSTMVDKNGNLWFGTNGGGVSRYDGRSFLHFNEKNGLSGNKILTLFQDSRGVIWMGTEGDGVCGYDGRSFITITKDDGLGNNTVLAVSEDKKGNVWFGTNGGGVSCFDGAALTNYTEKQGLSSGSVRSILCDSKGDLWFGTTGAGACRFDGRSFYYLGEDEGLNSSIIHAIAEDEKGLIYFGTEDGGVNIYDGETVRYITSKRGLSSNCVVSLNAGKDGQLWIGTYDSGVCKYDGGQIVAYGTEHGLTNNYILSMSRDDSGSLWLGTLGGGVCRFNTGSFSHFTEKEGLGKNTVRSITEDAKGNLWFGTFGDGAIHYDGKSFKHFTEEEGLPSNRIKASLLDSDGNIWFGTEEDGAVRFNGSSFESFKTAQGLSSNYILSMCKDKEGRIWFGTDEGGVCFYDGRSMNSIVDEEGLSNGIIYAIMQDSDGNMWFGTDGYGACCFDGKFLKWYTTRTGLAGNVVRCIAEDKDKNIWFGTEGNGLSKISSASIHSKEPRFEQISEMDGLSNNSIRSMVQDNKGNIWIATEKGLNYLVNRNGKHEIHTYTSADGLKANNFFNSVIIDRNNVIWWGNGKALTNLDLNTYQLPENKPKIQLINLELEQNFVDFNWLADTISKNGKVHLGKEEKRDLSRIRFSDVAPFYNYPSDLSLPHNINHLDFHFSAIDWSAANKIRYQYMLAGSDVDWSPLSTNNKASFNNLAHGNYTFRVRALGVSGKWSDTLEYSFSIRAPWYLTIWAYAFYVIAFFGIVVGFNNIRTRQLKARQQELEHTVAERTAEVVAQKEIVEEKQKEILDSINYAKRIQSAMLASDHLFAKNLRQYFVLFRPKDIVSGDFYWASPVSDNKFVLVTADSTGHGVPGAMMSMLNISCLNEAINERKYTSPARILDHARTRIISSLAEDGSEEGGKDGMDCSVVVFDFKNKTMTTAAANNPVWVVRTNSDQKELIEIKPDRMPVGKHARDTVPFTEKTFELREGDVVYTFTDGYCDQFGGEKQKKFTYKRLKELLLRISDRPKTEQKQTLEGTFEKWRGTNEQVDDVLIIGVRV